MNKCEWQDFEDVKTVYTKAFGVPEVINYSVNRYSFSCHPQGFKIKSLQTNFKS